MKDRIKQFIDYKGISAGDLATLLEVQRSNISHILNGRNKPGASLIEKMLKVFPDINARWLLTGEGAMLEGEAKQDEKEVPVEKPVLTKQQSEVQMDEQATASGLSAETIDKVVLLFSDGTFKTFKHRSE